MATPIFALYNKLPKNTRRIRLLTILPNGDDSTIVECYLQECDLDDDEAKYDALSYCWGNSEEKNTTGTHGVKEGATNAKDQKKQVVNINGQEKKVTTNLKDALRQFRSNSTPNSMMLWVDALCINQEDYDERGHQVQIMGDIYCKAARVHVWLGKSFSQVQRGLEAIERWSMCDCNADSVCNYSLEDQFRFRSRDDYRDMHAISLVCQAPYWKRLWVLQEVALNKNVVLHYGPHQSRLSCLRRVITRALANRADREDFEDRFSVALASGDVGEVIAVSKHCLSRAVTKLRLLYHDATPVVGECPSSSQGRQRIYGSLGLFDLAGHALWVRNHVTLERRPLLASTMAAFGRQQASDPRDYVYGILGLFGSHLSIVPNYTDLQPETLFAKTTFEIIRTSGLAIVLECASCDTGTLASWAVDFQSEQCRFWKSLDVIGYLAEMLACPALPSLTLSAANTRAGVLELEGLVFDTIERLLSIPSNGTREELVQSILAFGLFRPLLDEKQWRANIVRAYDRCFEFTKSNAFFLTSKGHLGMAVDAKLRIGDLVCVFLAPAQRLFCLRPVKSTIKSAHVLVGHCAIWRERNPSTPISPLGAIREVVETKHGGNWFAKNLFQPIIMV